MRLSSKRITRELGLYIVENLKFIKIVQEQVNYKSIKNYDILAAQSIKKATKRIILAEELLRCFGEKVESNFQDYVLRIYKSSSKKKLKRK